MAMIEPNPCDTPPSKVALLWGLEVKAWEDSFFKSFVLGLLGPDYKLTCDNTLTHAYTCIVLHWWIGEAYHSSVAMHTGTYTHSHMRLDIGRSHISQWPNGLHHNRPYWAKFDQSESCFWSIHRKWE